MSPYLRKELRLVVPTCLLILAVIGLVMLAPRHPHQGVSFGLVGLPMLIVCPCLVILMTIGMFDREISPDMIGQFLSQPISRKRIWGIKTTLLSFLIGSLWLCWWPVVRHHFSVNHNPSELGELRTQSLLVAFTLLSGGLWAILVTRSVAAAFWTVVVLPSSAFILRDLFLEGRVKHPEYIVNGMLALYAVGGFILAFRLFLRLNQTSSHQEVIAVVYPTKNWLQFPSRVQRSRQHAAWLALIWKEAQSLQGFLGFVLWNGLVHLACVALRSKVHFEQSPNAAMLLTYCWVGWLILPVMIGAQLIAEERRLGVWQAQLCLPVRRSRQLLVKALVAISLTLILSVALPLIIEQNNLFVEGRFDAAAVLRERGDYVKQGSLGQAVVILAEIVQALPFHPQPALWLSLISMVLLSVSVYASSLTRSLLHALTLGTTAFIGLLTLFLWMTSQPELAVPLVLRRPLAAVLVLPVLWIAVLWLTARNANQVDVGMALWKRNAAFLLGAVLTCSLFASTIYHRAWERLSPLEPPHQQAVLKMEAALRLDTRGRGISFISRDGRAWNATQRDQPFYFWNRYFADSTPQPLNPAIAQVPGSNWAYVVRCQAGYVGIQKDGSLWASETPIRRQTPSVRTGESLESLPRMIQVGQERDWKRMVPFGFGALLLNSNGTLWSFESPNPRLMITNYPGLAHQMPVQMTPGIEWADLRDTMDGVSYGFELIQKDGTAWIYPSQETKLSDRLKLDDRTELSRARYLDSGRAERRAIVMASPTAPIQVAINPEGHLSVVAVWASSHDARKWGYKPADIPLPQSLGDRWIDVASPSRGVDGPLIALKADGTLWRWHFPSSPVNAPHTATPIRLGTHSDWIALAPFQQEALSLAADGSLWAWQFESPVETGFLRWLAPSSKPTRLGNILTALK